jgi:hypothetical protein
MFFQENFAAGLGRASVNFGSRAFGLRDQPLSASHLDCSDYNDRSNWLWAGNQVPGATFDE